MNSDQRRSCVFEVLLVVVAVGIYANSNHNPFVFDDLRSIVDNQDIKRLWPPTWAPNDEAHHPPVNSRPLVSLSLALNYAVGGLSVTGYHLFNLGIHLSPRWFCSRPCCGCLAGKIGCVRRAPEPVGGNGFSSVVDGASASHSKHQLRLSAERAARRTVLPAYGLFLSPEISNGRGNVERRRGRRLRRRHGQQGGDGDRADHGSGRAPASCCSDPARGSDRLLMH